MSYRNICEMRICGIKRSGNHAILGWIKKNQPPPVVHFNDISCGNPSPLPHTNRLQLKSADPYRTFGAVNIRGLPFWKCKPKLTSLLKYLFERPREMTFVRGDPKIRLNFIRACKKNTLILSYENCFLDEDIFHEFDSKHDQLVGKSKHRYEIVILRDAYNLFASLIKSGRAGAENVKQYIRLYKQYAREFLGLTNLSDRNDYRRILINFNQWFASSEYRASILRKIGHSTPEGTAYMRVPSEGGGSSFSGTMKTGNAAQLGVLERWKQLTGNPLYESVFQDAELRELTDHTFELGLSGNPEEEISEPG